MNIVISGAGEVGRYSAEVLASKGHNITVIDLASDKLAALEETLDVRSLQGNAAQADVLINAGCREADLFIAATQVDEINLLAAAVAKGVGAKQTIARIHHSPFFDKRGLDYAHHLNIDHLVCPEYSTALAIASTLRSPGALAIEQFARGKIEMQSLPVSDNAKAVGQRLRDLRLPGSARIGAIERDRQAFLPEAQTRIQADDVITLIGDGKHFAKIRKLFHTTSETPRRIMIIGGTSQAVWLCRTLQGRGFSIRLFEPDHQRAEELSEKLGWVTVIRSDAIHTDVLEEERIRLVDTFIAMTAEDEQNILVAARAKTMGAKNAIAVLQRSTYLHLLSHVGIDKAFSPRATAVAEIQRLILPGPVRNLATLAEGIADVYEVQITPDAKDVIGRPLKALQLPPRCMVAAIHRGNDVFVPGAESVFLPDDMVILIGPTGSQKSLKQMFSASGASWWH